MKAKTRVKLAARGLGPLVRPGRPGRPGRGRRGILAPESVGRDAGASAGGVVPDSALVVSDDGSLGEFVAPAGDAVRQRVRLRPVVREALDAEARRLGMTREGLCRVVLEEVARKAAGAHALADVDVEGVAPDPGSGAVEAPDPAPIPAAYVGSVEDEDPRSASACAVPVDAGAGGGDAVSGSVPDPPSSDGRELLPSPGRRSAVVRPSAVRRVSRCLGGRVRVRGVFAAVVAVALVVVLSIAALAVSWRYEVAPAGGDGVYVVDRWRGAVWRCGALGGGRPSACTVAVFRYPVTGGDVAQFGRAGVVR